jgi:ribosomal-protein-alanine acetyltransferase
VRAATAADAPAVTELEAAVFGPDAWSAGSVAEELTGPRRRAWVAEVADSAGVVGYAVSALAGDVVDLQRVAVAPARRGRGIASSLVATLIDAARSDGAARVLLEVAADNEAALGLYARHGFTEVDRRPAYYRDGRDALVLQLSLEEEAT